MSEQSPVYSEPRAAELADLLSSSTTSPWLKTALLAALEVDPERAADEAQMLAAVLAGRRPTSRPLLDVAYRIKRADGSLWQYRAHHSPEQHRDYIAVCATALQPGEQLSFVNE